ncbi:MAG: GNAT family N-acetyltransferase [Bacteroidota bacterium]
MQVRKATLEDLPHLIDFTKSEAMDAEGMDLDSEQVRQGIRMALEDSTKAMYWVLTDEEDTPVGSISALREWSDWRAGYYWWIQSLYLAPKQRGKGHAARLIAEVNAEMQKQNGLELRLYVHRGNLAAMKAYERIGFDGLDYEIMKLSRKQR